MNKKFLFVIIGAYLLLGMILLSFYRYQINPDGVSYISIAEKYAHGDFKDAINAYWGPLISWLIAPFLYFGFPALLSVKILSLLIGAILFPGVYLLTKQIEILDSIKKGLFITLIPITLYYSFTVITPDLLLTCILIFYFGVIFNPQYGNNPYKGILCGCLGAFSYFAKAYAFPFFLLHFFIFNALHYYKASFRRERKKVCKNFILGVCVFLAISSLWIYALGRKYKMFTIGTTGSFSYSYCGPAYSSDQAKANTYRDLFTPPNETAISIWEDPPLVNLISWNPVDSLENFRYQLLMISRNIYKIIVMFAKFTLLFFAIILGYLLLYLIPVNKQGFKNQKTYPLLTFFLYPLGYIPIVIDEIRYLWLANILLLLMGSHLLSVLLRSDFFNHAKRKFAIVVFALSFLVLPIKELAINFNSGKDIFDLSRILEPYNIKGSVVSNDLWPHTLYLSYYLGNQYYGEAGSKYSDEELLNELKKNKIDYYFEWQAPSKRSKVFHSNFKEIVALDKVNNLRIFTLKKEDKQ